jgi:hypothetical protein
MSLMVTPGRMGAPLVSIQIGILFFNCVEGGLGRGLSKLARQTMSMFNTDVDGITNMG